MAAQASCHPRAHTEYSGTGQDTIQFIAVAGWHPLACSAWSERAERSVQARGLWLAARIKHQASLTSRPHKLNRRSSLQL